MTNREGLVTVDVEEHESLVLITPKKEEWETLRQRAEHAIELRRVTRKARENKPITFATPSLWSLSGSTDDH